MKYKALIKYSDQYTKIEVGEEITIDFSNSNGSCLNIYTNKGPVHSDFIVHYCEKV